MEKVDLMAIGSILKFALGFSGIATTLILLISGLATKNKRKLKKSGLVFLGTWLLLIILAAIEFFFLAN